MKFSEHHPKDVRTNSLGATYDTDKELSGSENSGTYFDSENGRVTSDIGNTGSWEKIGGEVEEHSNVYPGDWFCMCSIKVNLDKFELWVEKNESDSPYIVINGSVMGKSDKMPWLYDHRIQFDKNESCIGGEVYLTDFNVPPMILNIKDIKDNFANGTQKYFLDFNPDLYYINLSSPLDIPIFTGLVNLGGGGGLPVGSYQYSLRYKNEDGDATNWGPLTPTIPVVQSLSVSSGQYPSIKTFGGSPDLSSITAYGIKLRFRVTNINNYDYIEIRRISYNVGGGIDYVPEGKIVAKIDITPGEISVRDFVDPQESNVDEGADNEGVGQLTTVNKAKAIRYEDKRLVLMNFETPSKVAELDVIPFNGKKIFPIVESIGRDGHNDPVNHTYKKNYSSNEKFSFAISVFDGNGGSGFVVEDDDLKNIEAPSRREPMDVDSFNLSNGAVTAADVNSSVGNTFEVFDHENAITKTDYCSFKNILKVGNKFTPTVNQYCSGIGAGPYTNASEIGYQPFRPVDQSDVVSGHNYRPNMEVSDSSSSFNYDPKGFGINYYTRGFALGGVDNLPSWVKSFSIVRSDPAGRVVCQGIGMYSLEKGDFGTFGNSAAATKDNHKLWFHSPDIESGIVSSAVLDDMQVNPQNYALQFVSPLGFFSEVYHFEKRSLFPNRDRLVDMMTYARIIRDSGQINPNESPSMGVNGYVAYNRYRNANNAGQGLFNVPEGGNRIVPLAGFNFKSSGRSSYYELETFDSIYNVGNTGGTGANDFDDLGMKNFTEPFYMVNIIRTGADVQDLNINSYQQTGHYQKIESIIGIGDGTTDQSFILVDERWEDCIPSLSSTGYNSGGESFIYLVDDQGNETICLNVTYYNTTLLSTVISDITSNGFYLTPGGVEVQGVFTHSQDVNGNIYVNFNTPYTIPTQEQKVVVKYDKTRPIRFFGGDSVVGENIFAPLDLEADGTTGDQDQLFDFNIGFPYRRFKMNPRIYTVRDTTTSGNKIQDDSDMRLGYIRQMCIMYAAESRTSTPLAFNVGDERHFFPMTHYVMRPSRWDSSSFDTGDNTQIADDNNMYVEYFEDYPLEYTKWKYGGFRFLPNFNIDYSVKGPKLYFSKPDVGFQEENKFCSGVIWSLPRAINQQDSPGLKTFPGTNRYLATDANGGIKKAWSARTGGKGSNLYAITESGICLLLTKKAILSNISADDLTVTASDSFISGEYWISNKIGSTGEMWRGMAEGSVELDSDQGKVEMDTLFIPNNNSIYKLSENVVIDIAKDRYHSRISPSLSNIPYGYFDHVIGHFDKSNNEYWLQIPDVNNEGIQRCFVYSNDTNHWIGRFHYSFDSYLLYGLETKGFRDGKMFNLNEGFIINGSNIEAKLIQHTSKEIIEEKEFISIEVNTGPRGTMKPTEIVFMDEEMNILSRLNEPLFGPKYLKQYSGWFQQIPRKEDSVSSDRERIQYRLILFEINHNKPEKFKVVSSVIQYKSLK